MNEGGAGTRAAVAWGCQSFAKLLIENTQTGPIPSNNPQKDIFFSPHPRMCLSLALFWIYFWRDWPTIAV